MAHAEAKQVCDMSLAEIADRLAEIDLERAQLDRALACLRAEEAELRLWRLRIEMR